MTIHFFKTSSIHETFLEHGVFFLDMLNLGRVLLFIDGRTPAPPGMVLKPYEYCDIYYHQISEASIL